MIIAILYYALLVILTGAFGFTIATCVHLLGVSSVRDLRLQPQYTLQEAYTTPEGEHIRAVRYVADFSYEKEVADIGRAETDDTGLFWKIIPTAWLPVVEDVKSTATKTDKYAIKKKLMQERYGISIREI